MSKVKLIILCLLATIIWYGCEKETTEVQVIDPLLQEQWSFTTDEFVSWSDIYDRYIVDKTIAKSQGQKIRSANEDEADIVNQIFAAENMQAQVSKISNEIGVPDWSKLMTFVHGSSHEIFELFVPLLKSHEISGILTITNNNDDVVVRATKRNSLDHLVLDDVERDLIHAQVPTIAAFNIFDKIKYKGTTPTYEYWFDEVFSDGYTKESDYNAKCYVYTRTYWVTERTSSVTLTYREVTLTSYVDCGIPKEPQDPFGTNSEVIITPIDLSVKQSSSGATFEEDKDVRTYVDLSPFKPVFEETIIDSTSTKCVKDILAKIKNNSFGPDLFVQILRDIFDTNTKVNITVIEAPLSNNREGTYQQGPGGGFQDVVHFDGTITLNSNLTANATQDWILATLIHEMIHGYINYQRELLARNLITQIDFNRKFPIFTDGKDEMNHDTMGHLYVGTIADISQRNNPNLQRKEALGLARVGLEETGFWNLTLTQSQRDESSLANKIGKGITTSQTSFQINC